MRLGPRWQPHVVWWSAATSSLTTIVLATSSLAHIGLATSTLVACSDPGRDTLQ